MGKQGATKPNSARAFRKQQQATGTGHVKYNPVVGTDVVLKPGFSKEINIKQHCITFMAEYENKSLEELRLEDYVAGRKGSSNMRSQTERKPLFGNSFGFVITSTTGSTTLGPFGSTQSKGTGLFEHQNKSLGEGELFSNNADGDFSKQKANGTGHVKFDPVREKSGCLELQHQCITCMTEYRNKSLEELRLEDYMAGRKGSSGKQTNQKMFGSASLFGSTNTTGGLFGGSTASTSTGGFGASTSGFGFGATTQPASGGLFGNTSNVGGGLFGQNNQSAFGAKPTGFGFGSTSTAGATTVGSLFGSTPSTGTGLFEQQTRGGLFSNNADFGQPATTSAPSVFGGGALGRTTAFAQANTSFSFGNNAQNTTTTGLFGANKPAFGATPTSDFGQQATTSTPSVFWGTTAFAQANTSFSFGNNAQNTTTTGLFGANKPAFGATPTSGAGLFGAPITEATTTKSTITSSFGPAFGATTIPGPGYFKAPTTQATTTQAPTAQVTTAQVATTQATTTQVLTTQATTNQVTTTQVTTTQATTTQAPTAQAPTAQAPTAQAPTAQVTATQATTTRATATQGPTFGTNTFTFKLDAKTEKQQQTDGVFDVKPAVFGFGDNNIFVASQPPADGYITYRGPIGETSSVQRKPSTSSSNDDSNSIESNQENPPKSPQTQNMSIEAKKAEKSTDYFFKSMANKVKRFPKEKRVEIERKIFQIISDEELKLSEEKLNLLHHTKTVNAPLQESMPHQTGEDDTHTISAGSNDGSEITDALHPTVSKTDITDSNDETDSAISNDETEITDALHPTISKTDITDSNDETDPTVGNDESEITDALHPTVSKTDIADSNDETDPTVGNDESEITDAFHPTVSKTEITDALHPTVTRMGIWPIWAANIILALLLIALLLYFKMDEYHVFFSLFQ